MCAKQYGVTNYQENIENHWGNIGAFQNSRTETSTDIL